MEQSTAINKWDVVNDPSISRSFYRKGLRNETNLVFQKLVSEGCESFFSYFEWLGLTDDPNIIILPSTGHYFYDAEDMKEVKTVVNMKQLNQIKQIKDFMHNIYHILAHQSYLIGIFVDKKYQTNLSNSGLNQFEPESKVDPVENGIESKIPFLNMMYNIMDSKTNRYMSKTSVSLLLTGAGFKVLNMTTLNGLTFFCAQKVKPSAE
jgi:hypothetical protein